MHEHIHLFIDIYEYISISFLGWFLYIGLQFGGVYIVFFVPFMKQFFPDYDFYFVQTYLHTETWFK